MREAPWSAAARRRLETGQDTSITSITITGTDPGDFAENNTCGSQLGAQKKCTITVTFTPTATGSRSASVSISDNGGGSPQTALSGTGQ
jgi:Abnormal spindle-like microcephaly-assoc'd, ASPM-SPD-2-Hydin